MWSPAHGPDTHTMAMSYKKFAPGNVEICYSSIEVKTEFISIECPTIEIKQGINECVVNFHQLLLRLANAEEIIGKLEKRISALEDANELLIMSSEHKETGIWDGLVIQQQNALVEKK